MKQNTTGKSSALKNNQTEKNKMFDLPIQKERLFLTNFFFLSA
jgi:hypothetical protein